VDAGLAEVHNGGMAASAVIYLRISSDRTGQQAGVTRQREDCERRARERGWTVVAVEKDNDQSAKTGRRREGYEAMLRRIADGEARVVIAWSLDRLQRNRADELRLWEVCQATGTLISLVNGADLDLSTAGGRLVADQLASVARYEVELKADRQAAAQAQAAKAGKRVGGRRPFGYEQDGVIIREGEAAAVYKAFDTILNGGTIGDVVRQLNDAGFTTGQNGRKGDRVGKPSPWTRSSARDLLTSPRYAGLRHHIPEEVRKAAGGRRVDKAAHIIGKATWEPLVDEGTWRAVQDILRDPKRRTAPQNAQALLTGVARCGVCGNTIHSGGAAKTQKWRVYRCRSMKHVSRVADPVDEYISDVVVERLSREDARDLLVDTDRPDAGHLREQAVALRTRLDGAAAAYAQGAIELTQLTTITADLKAQIADVEARMADAGRLDVLGPLVTAEDVRAVWDGLSVSRRRTVIDLLMEVRLHAPGRGTRTFRPETVEVHWRR
jgi:site-specific DNA recombinase